LSNHRPRDIGKLENGSWFSQAENARVSEVTVEDVTLKKLGCRFHTAEHPQVSQSRNAEITPGHINWTFDSRDNTSLVVVFPMQTDCEHVGVLDLNSNEPAVSARMVDLTVLVGGEAGWSCTGPPMVLAAPSVGVAPPLPASCAGAAAPVKTDDDDEYDVPPRTLMWGGNALLRAQTAAIHNSASVTGAVRRLREDAAAAALVKPLSVTNIIENDYGCVV
jgi:hypothetical protein